ncbi:MAG: hypothetical protein IPI57_12250 [Candidatus Competibacteraceae bacterium]|nr:hypothetical protein [Candidatus Competibacteraceae bacterium]
MRTAAGTRDLGTGPYALDVFCDAVYEQPPVTDYALCFDGHGINSWALHYYLAREPLALFIQLPRAEPTSTDEARTRISDTFALAATLTTELAGASRAGASRRRPAGSDR